MFTDNKLHLPSNYGNGSQEIVEEQQYKELLIRQYILGLVGHYNRGLDTVVLASGADGSGNHSYLDSLQTYDAALRLTDELSAQGQSVVKTMRNAEISDLEDAVRNEQVANIFVLGHSSYHIWVGTDRSIGWYELGKVPRTHLKNGVFANLGCGALHSWAGIPLGRFVVGDKGTLLGKRAELTTSKEMGSLQSFKILKKS